MPTHSSPYREKIKLFADGADYNSMLELAGHPNIKGFTTNPSLMRKAGVSEYAPFCKKVLREIGQKPISFEIFADEFESMDRQAREIASWANNVYVKIPVTNSKGESTIPLIKTLTHEGIKLNITAIFTLEQLTSVALALKGGAPSVASVFAGRIADAGIDPVPVMAAAAGICRSQDSNIELLWASTREIFNVVQAEQAGCHIITVPHPMLGKIKNFGSDLVAASLKTVLAFKQDSEAAGYNL